ncbi:hypothetical protein KAJ87_00010 [Candidatus Pacearchaeota archaeon]|nr:hypothetical protein [Candidatus Pacearchaeota archaeon]
MAWKRKNKEFLFDFKESIFVNERILEKYLLKGKLKDYNESFLVVCDKDKEGNKLSYNFSLDKIGKIIQSQQIGGKRKGLDFYLFENPFEELLLKSQWFARFNYYDPISIVSKDKIRYLLRMPHQKSTFGKDGFIVHNSYLKEIFRGGPFQTDKLSQDKVLISEVSSKKLDEIIRNVYKERIIEQS